LANATAVLDVRTHTWTDWPLLEAVWDRLSGEVELPSFFLGASWVSAWMSEFAPLLRPEILVFLDGGKVRGLCLLVRRAHRHGPVPVTRLYVNTAGEDEGDATTVEYNGLVCPPGWEARVAEALFKHVATRRWDELVLPGFRPGAGLDALLAASPWQSFDREIKPSFYIDLERVRRKGLSFDQTLSAGTRRQVRRSTALYQQGGPVEVECAADVAAAHRMMDELVALHQAAWAARGKPGAFASPRYLAFHRRLISEAHPGGGVHLLKVKNARQTIGVLYNFVRGTGVSFYQSGLNYSDDNRLKPGLVAHCQAVEFYLARGYGEYDLLAGRSRYKASLAGHERPLEWVVIERDTPRMRAVRSLRSAKARYESLFGARRGRPPGGEANT
jgi:CelD/BcsL family acetyltransferase involved in cellulose biosynthesis